LIYHTLRTSSIWNVVFRKACSYLGTHQFSHISYIDKRAIS
jgi:hypothetical protein